MSIQRNKEAMKRFETMINTCDGARPGNWWMGRVLQHPRVQCPLHHSPHAVQARRRNAFY